MVGVGEDNVEGAMELKGTYTKEPVGSCPCSCFFNSQFTSPYTPSLGQRKQRLFCLMLVTTEAQIKPAACCSSQGSSREEATLNLGLLPRGLSL